MSARRWLVVAGVVAIALVAAAPAASAHPLGNFTSNTYAGLRVEPDGIAVDYVLDLAEIPTQQTRPSIDTDGDGEIAPAEAARFEADRCAALAGGLSLAVDGAAVRVASTGGRLTFPPGLAGLSILRLECDLAADTGALPAGAEVRFEDANLADRIGWHEITAAGDGTTLHDSDVPDTSPSDRLRAYPPGRASLEIRTATFSVTPGGDRLSAGAGATLNAGPAAAVPGADRATRLFSSLIADHDFTLGFGLVAIGISIVLGAFHAFAPGHGKTVIAAYVVGQRGRLRHAIGIGVSVAVTHTAGVLVLGLVLYSSERLAPERIYPVLGTISGLLVAAVGIGLLRRVVRGLRAGSPAGHSHGTGPGQHTHAWLEHLEHDLAHERVPVLVGAGAPMVEPVPHHHHDHAHDHDHDHAHDHDHDAPAPGGDSGEIRWGSLLAMGFAGGMVPSPSAVIVLLGALTLGKTWFGLTLVLAYGLGLALTLLAAGLLLVKARRWLEPRFGGGSRGGRVARYLPAVTAVAVMGGGLLLAARAVASA